MKLKRNVPIFYFTSALMWGRFFIPVLALFYIASKVTLAQFSLIMGIFSLSIFLLEVPTGVIADLLGKKKTLLLSRFCYIIEIILIAFFNGFWVFLIAKIISGIGVSLSSGTGSAMLFDTLKKQKRVNQHKRISGSISMVSNISMAFVFIIGAYLFSIDPKLPAIVSLPFIILGFLLTFFLEEPYKPNKIFNVKNYFKHLKEGFIYFNKSPYIKYIALLSLFVSAAISISLSMSSVYFEKILIPVSFIGVLAFVAAMITAFSSKKAHELENFFGEKKSLILIQISAVVALFLIALLIPYYGYLLYLIIPFISGFSGVILGDYINHHIQSSHRSTILSINGMFSNFGIFVLFPLIGFIEKGYGFSNSFLIFGLIVLIGLIILNLFSRKIYSDDIPKPLN
jgi:MFS family permease